MKTIAIADGTHEAMLEEAETLNHMKLVHLVEAYRRGWQMLTPGQKLAAMMNASKASEPAQLGSPDPVLAASEIGTATSELIHTAAAAKVDGDVSDQERQTIRELARGVQQKAAWMFANV
jgi:uncharacterized membrane protein YebE (DUF533 family)